ncbi:hypothetical protein [Persephonella sp. KM09-Lau-8]|uniref:hypothetical protein n=1 Tax=Persephonella sp. KM09-Lau-8 TaxID=1158345 RepID=UPI000497048C|nr:hypothetical protein [Persephonella sp. KM09-Lau-8]
MRPKIYVKEFYFEILPKEIKEEYYPYDNIFSDMDLIDIYINGKKLIEYVYEYEKEYIFKDIELDDETPYDRFSPIPLNKCLLDNCNNERFKRVLGILMCSCQTFDCWDLDFRIFFGDKYIIWFDFTNFHRKEEYKNFPIYIFPKEIYKEGIKNLECLIKKDET